MADAGPPDSESYFDARYRAAQRQSEAVPWANMAPNPFVAERVASLRLDPGRAVVVACGLGDDAEFLAARRWRVTAFDISSTAIEWCRERFPESIVDYRVADIFHLPLEWTQAFSLVVEVATIQSLAPEYRSEVVERIAALVGPGGSLLVAALGRRSPEPGAGPPWPVSKSELGHFEASGLEEVGFGIEPSEWPGFDRFSAEYRRA